MGCVPLVSWYTSTEFWGICSIDSLAVIFGFCVFLLLFAVATLSRLVSWFRAVFDCCFCHCGSSLLQRSVCALLVLHHLCVCSAWLAACETARTASGTFRGSNSATGGAVQRWRRTFNVTLFLRSISISIFVHLLSFLENLPTRYNDNYSWPTFH